MLADCYPDIDQSCSNFSEVVFELCIKCLMKLLQKSTKTHKNEKNEECACMNIFKRIVGMILIVFVGSNTPLSSDNHGNFEIIF